MNTPLISVIVPVYNAEKWLRRCVESILNQTSADFELILVDDGSTDGSSELCDTLSAEDPRIKVIHQPNGGVSAARNTGIKAAQGEYLTFVDADDWIESNYISDLYAALENGAIDFAFSGRLMHHLDGMESRYIPDALRMDKSEFGEFFVNPTFLNLRGGPFSKIFKKKIISCNNIQFPSDIHYLEDAIFVLKYLLKCRSIISVNNSSYHYELHDGSLVFTVSQFENEIHGYKEFKKVAEECEKRFNLIGDENRWLHDNLLFMIGRQLTALKKNKKSCKLLEEVDWDFYVKHFNANTLKGRIYIALISRNYFRRILNYLRII